MGSTVHPAPAPKAAAPLEQPAKPASGSRPPASSVLGLEPLSLTPEEYARLEALLGPKSEPKDALSKDGDKDTGAPAATPGSSKTDDASARRRVRVLIVPASR